MYIIAINPPSHILKETGRIQQILFRKFGYISALSFTPFIPVITLKKKPEMETFSQVFTQNTAFLTESYTLAYNSLYINTLENPLWIKLGELFPEADYDQAVIRSFPGLFICVDEKNTLTRELSQLPLLPVFRWNSSEISCIKTDTNGIESGWWKNVKTEEVWKIKLKRG